MNGRDMVSQRAALRALKERSGDSGARLHEAVPGEIQRSWTRCAKSGVSLAGSRDPGRLTSSELKQRAVRFERLVGGAAPIMHNLSRQIANTRSMVVLSDPEGLILHSVGDNDFLSRAARVALQPGVRWDEESKGTNAIGTAAVERKAVLVHAAEHYVERNQFLTCSASPIFDGCGQLAGILDISGDYRSYQDHTLALVRLGAQMIEERLFEEAARGNHLVRFHPQRAYLFSLAEGRAAFSDAGVLVALNQAGREWLGTPSVGEDFERLFGFPFEQALSRSRLGGGAVLACTLPRGTPIALALTLAPPLRTLQSAAMAGHGAALPTSATATASASRTVFGTIAAEGDAGADQTLSAIDTTGQASRLALQSAALQPAPQEIGRHDARMGEAVNRARKVMQAGIPLLIEGESGTGKEWLARALHEHGPRRSRPFVAVNCAAIPDALIESELFGYEEGAFTGARRRGSPGRIRDADGGTLFLDEIGDMPINLQARLLRVLQDRAVTPLGSSRSYPVDINVVCATHRRLRYLVSAGLFREDLYYRLNGFTVGLPALRDRADLEHLVNALLATEAPDRPEVRVSAEAMALFTRHPWPGNIRQLRNVLRTGLALMEDDGVLGVSCLAEDFLEEARQPKAALPPLARGIAAADLGGTAASGMGGAAAPGMGGAAATGMERPGTSRDGHASIGRTATAPAGPARAVTPEWATESLDADGSARWSGARALGDQSSGSRLAGSSFAGASFADAHYADARLAGSGLAGAGFARDSADRSAAPRATSGCQSLQESEWRAIQDALRRHDGNVSGAARELGISRNRLYRRLRQFGEGSGSTTPQR